MAYKRVKRTYNDQGFFICDTAADIANLPGVGNAKIGSIAFVSKDASRYTLAPSGWNKIKGDSGDGGGSCYKIKTVENNQITDPEWLASAEPGVYYGTIDDTTDYCWPYESGSMDEGVLYPVFMEIYATDDGMKLFKCHSGYGEFKAIFDPETSNAITFFNIVEGPTISEPGNNQQPA